MGTILTVLDSCVMSKTVNLDSVNLNKRHQSSIGFIGDRSCHFQKTTAPFHWPRPTTGSLIECRATAVDKFQILIRSTSSSVIASLVRS